MPSTTGNTERTLAEAHFGDEMPQRQTVGVSSGEIVCTGEVFEWRGPAPFHFVSVSGENAELIREQAAAVTYGWGMIPVSGIIGRTAFTTSLWPKGDEYYLPLKDAVRRAEGIEIGSVVTARLELRAR